MKFKIVHSRLNSLCYYLLFSFSIFSIQNFFAQDNYNIGVGIYDITGEIAEANYFGYADPFHRNKGIRDRQYARAFIIEEPDGRPVVFVCIDKGATFQSVNQAVLEKLKATYGNLYQDENVIISATHTHVAAGGQSHFSLYELATGGYWKTNFDNTVEGIYGAIVRAHNTMAPGSVYFNKGALGNASINRSLVAYENNVDANEYESIDEEMTVLKFTQGGKEVGMISWFAVHATNLSNSYQYNSADNKGYAALKFERLKNSTYEEDGAFVAAFANTNAGDMSPNLNLPSVNNPNENATGPGANEEESADIIGTRQYDKAMELYVNATTKLIGSVNAISRYTDFSNVSIDPKFTDGETENTCRAALGVSFTAGAEDGRSGLGVLEGITKNPDSGATIDQCHAEKPIMPLFYLGSDDENPDTPKILPTTLMKIGQLGILGAPSEFTVMSGRRTRATVEAVSGTGITETVLAGYSDAYAGYVTTREEYASQQYEGASTHFGPWTLAAYQQEFERLATKLLNPSLDPWPNVEPEIPFKETPADVTTSILFDSKPFGIQYGNIDSDVDTAYSSGEKVEVTFWGAHPNNDLKVNSTYLSVEYQEGNDWETLYEDRDTNTKLTWERNGVTYSKIIVEWTIPNDSPTGNYRIRHFGKSKQIFSGRLSDYTGTSSVFYVNSRATKIVAENNSKAIKNSVVYPNPNQGDFILNIKEDSVGSFEIIDILGQNIGSGIINAEGELNISLDVEKGIYFLNVKQLNGESYSHKVVVE